MREILETLHIPSSCKISKKIFKKQFTENFSLSMADKKILTNDIESITLEYLLNKTPHKHKKHFYKVSLFKTTLLPIFYLFIGVT